MGGRTRSKQLAEELAFSPSVRLGERHEWPHIFDRLCRIVDEMTTSGNRGSLRAASRAVRLAGRLDGPGRCKLCRRPFRPTRQKTPRLARAFARLAAALRLRERFGHANAALLAAFQMDPPAQIQGDLYRRRTHLRIYQERWAEALADAHTALRLSPPGHRRALALLALGTALYEMDSVDEAIKRLKEAVQTLDPVFEHEFIGALICYANALAKGTDEDVREGLRVCADARSRLKPQHRMQRAKLWWVEGSLRHRLGEERKAWQAFNTARLSLVAMKAAPEVAAITADMARVAPLPRTVANMCHEAGGAIPVHHPLALPLQTLREANRGQIPLVAGRLREAAERLAACPPGR